MNNCLYFLDSNESRRLVTEGFYRGIYYCIISRRLYPCCYIAIGKGNPLNGIYYDDMNIKCHGNLTFSRNYINEGVSKVADIITDQGAWFIGWDYAHAGDFIAGVPSRANDKEWTLRELLRDIEYSIDQVTSVSPVTLYN